MPCQLFVRPLSFDTGTADSTSQLFEYIKQCFHVNGLILLPESTLSKEGLLGTPHKHFLYPQHAHTHAKTRTHTHTHTHTHTPCHTAPT